MGATCGRCTAVGADVMTASQVPAHSTFYSGVWRGLQTFLVPSLAPFLDSRWGCLCGTPQKEETQELLTSSLLHDQFCASELETLDIQWNIDHGLLITWATNQKMLGLHLLQGDA